MPRARLLKKVALATGGAYIPAGTKQVDMAHVYHNVLANVDQLDFETARINSYVPRYQWFVGLGLLLLVVDTLLPAARHRTPGSSSLGRTFVAIISRTRKTAAVDNESDKKLQSTGTGITAACLAVLFLLPQTASAAEPAELVRQANEALHAGDACAPHYWFANVTVRSITLPSRINFSGSLAFEVK